MQPDIRYGQNKMMYGYLGGWMDGWIERKRVGGEKGRGKKRKGKPTKTNNNNNKTK